MGFFFGWNLIVFEKMAGVLQRPPSTPTAEVVGNAFVHQYYLILHQSPELVHRFYQDSSKLGRPEENGVMSITTTMQAINEKILSLEYGDFTAEISTVDAQDSYNGGVLVLVTGYLTGKDNIKRKFTQSFFLAPQDRGYFVLNDVFRYVDDAKDQNGHYISANKIEVPPYDQDPSLVQENPVVEPPAVSSEVVNGGEVYGPYENGEVVVEEEEVKAPEVADEVPDDLQMVSETNSKVEDLPKKSYASIVKVMKESSSPSASPAPALSKSSVKSQEQQVTVAPPPTSVSDAPISNANTTESGNIQESEAEGPSIYLKGLPGNVTYGLIENEFKKFGTIRSGGIQIRNQKGFSFGFVEFEEASAVQSAIEASPVMMNGRKVIVEEKRSTSRGNRGRSSSGAGNGYRNEGGRGRGNYGGGRGYGRNDFGNRSEFGNRGGGRGGVSNHGGGSDGYQRADGAANGGRVNRSGGYAVNVAAKSMAPRVSASA